MGVVICNFVASWKSKDGKIKRKDVRELIRMYENQEKHDKKIRDMAIEELKNKICSHFADWQYTEDDKWIKSIIELASESVEEIAEGLKGDADER